MRAGLVLGDQLFALEHFINLKCQRIFMAEDYELCSRFKCHKLKLVFFIAAMRSYCSEIRSAGYIVDYIEFSDSKNEDNYTHQNNSSYEEKLTYWIQKNNVSEVCHFEIADSFFSTRISNLFKKLAVSQIVLPSPMFLDTTDSITDWMAKQKRPFLKSYYEKARIKSQILMLKIAGKLEPVGGQFSFDEANRLAIPRGLIPPPLPTIQSSELLERVKNLVENLFSSHPGSTAQVWIPVTRIEARQWLSDFFLNRFAQFGPYEDALSNVTPFLYHTAFSPLLNSGLLSPQEVLEAIFQHTKEQEIPLNSLEGLVRQIIGWREFIRGIYLVFEHKQNTKNYFNHHRKLAPCWWTASTGLLHLDRAIQKSIDFGYCHHIERLMVIGNVMLLCEINPIQAHAWFMQMFVDSADWVMGPNVFGMALFSDGGIFATKPYICGSNYWLKMSGDKKEPWCDDLDSLYWSFVNKHRDLLLKNPRMSMMVKVFDKIKPERKEFLLENAEVVKNRISFF